MKWIKICSTKLTCCGCRRHEDFLWFFALVLAAFASPGSAADLTGHWAVKEALGDGTVRATYLNLKQEGSRITGTIRATQLGGSAMHRLDDFTPRVIRRSP